METPEKYMLGLKMSNENEITILHFNDVYNIEPREKDPVGGAARFATALKTRKHLNPLVIFSGDAFNPSIMSSIFSGKQMVAVLNALDIDLAVFGNHDFDFGVDKAVKLAGETKFPWLLSNVLDNFTGKPLAEGKPTHMLEWAGKKIGFIGLVENDWIATLSSVDPDDITYIDFVTLGRSLAEELREEGADYVIALTHMRWPNDERLVQEVDGIDLVLGGHDHDFNVKQVNGKYVIKSGTDFRYVGHITLGFKSEGQVEVTVEEVIIDRTFDEDEEVKKIVTSYSEKLDGRMNKVIGEIDVDLEGRFPKVRTEETNLGNFIADIMLNATKADCALLNAGTLRSDMVHTSGQFKMKDLISILPFGGSVGVKIVTGKQLHKALEIGVSAYPAFEGRFPQVAGLSFGFDPNLPPMERVDWNYVKVQGVDLDLEKIYNVTVPDFLCMGKDGYEIFLECDDAVSFEEGPVLHSIIKNHFQSVKVCRGEKKLKYAHHQAILAITRMKALVKLRAVKETAENEEDEANGEKDEQAVENEQEKDGQEKDENQQENESSPSNVLGMSAKCYKIISRLISNMRKRKRVAFRRQNTRQEVEREALPCAVAPKVEGRIFILDSKKRKQLDLQKESDLGES